MGYARSASPASDTTLYEASGSPKLGPKLGLGGSSRFRLRWWLRVSVLLNVAAAVFFVHQHLSPPEAELIADISFTATEVEVPVTVPAPYIPGMEGGECSLCAVNPALCEELG
jgi:hypothetical protein